MAVMKQRYPTSEAVARRLAEVHRRFDEKDKATRVRARELYIDKQLVCLAVSA